MFKVEEVNRKFIMRALGRHWSRWKCSLKQLHYDTHDNSEDRLADIDKRIIPAQWPFLVHFWSSEEGQVEQTNMKTWKCLIIKATVCLGYTILKDRCNQ